MRCLALRDVWRLGIEFKSVACLALPIMAGLVGQTLMGIADTLMVGHVGLVPLASCALVVNLFHLPMVFGFGMLTSVSVFTASAFGAGDRVQSAYVFRASLWLSFSMGMVLACLLLSFVWFLPQLGQPPEVAAAAVDYLWYVAPSLLPLLLSVSGKQFCESLNRPWVPTLVMLLGVILNIVLNWMLIYGNLGCPEMGLEGAGLATLLARVWTAVALLAWVFQSHAIAPFRNQGSWWDVRNGTAFWQLVRLGMPVSVQHVLEMGAFVFAALMVGWIDASSLAAHQIIFTCVSTTFMFSLSIGQAASVRISQALGAGLRRRVLRLGWIGLSLSFFLMGCFACFFIFQGKTLVSLFIESDVVRQTAMPLLLVAAFFQVFDGLQVTAVSLLRGMQDVRVPALVAMVAYWCVSVPLGYWLAFPMGKGALGIWVGLAMGLALAAFALTYRFYFKAKRIPV
ncbi:MAG: MATE family efflux transporter [Verrucomicrobiota bacterium]|nr:MATE family efflux transporter [Verrucomicrobiota bacterium]